MTDEILNSYALTLRELRTLVTDLDTAQMVYQPAGVPNHPAWIIGHLVQSCEMIGGEIGLQPWLPAHWAEEFAPGSKPVPVIDAYPDKATLLSLLDDGEQRLRHALAAMSDSELARPLPGERYRDVLPTIGHAVLHILAGHTAIHLGQLKVWRRAAGLTIPAPIA
jgi:DinB family protein